MTAEGVAPGEPGSFGFSLPGALAGLTAGGLATGLIGGLLGGSSLGTPSSSLSANADGSVGLSGAGGIGPGISPDAIGGPTGGGPGEYPDFDPTTQTGGGGGGVDDNGIPITGGQTVQTPFGRRIDVQASPLNFFGDPGPSMFRYGKSKDDDLAQKLVFGDNFNDFTKSLF
jgi:hypothetical protein